MSCCVVLFFCHTCVLCCCLCSASLSAALPACFTCTTGYFPSPSSYCNTCPASSSRALALIGLLAAIAVTTYAVLRVKKHARLFEFLVWLPFSLHVLVQVTRSSAAETNTALYDALQLLQLDPSPYLHSDCLQVQLSVCTLQDVVSVCLFLSAFVRF